MTNAFSVHSRFGPASRGTIKVLAALEALELFVSAEQAALILGKSVSMITYLCRTGALKAKKVVEPGRSIDSPWNGCGQPPGPSSGRPSWRSRECVPWGFIRPYKEDSRGTFTKGGIQNHREGMAISEGEPPNTVTAYQRVNRSRIIEVRWWVGSLKSFRTRSLGLSIRDENGAVVEELEQEAVQRTQAIYDALMAGRNPGIAEQQDEGPLTVAAGFDLATAVPTGMYVVETRHLRDLRRAARDI